MSWELDHLVVAAATLDDGAEWIADRLGVRPGPGGRHPLMATHNLLLAIGPRIYLEVISVDRDASPPGRPRWFGLDRFSGSPRIVAWVVRTQDLDAALETAPSGSGTPLSLSRGPYRWRMAVPEDGVLPLDGVAPALIEWAGDAHPSDALAPSPLRLRLLDVVHPDPLANHLPAVAGVRYVTGAPALRAVFETAEGERELP